MYVKMYDQSQVTTKHISHKSMNVMPGL